MKHLPVFNYLRCLLPFLFLLLILLFPSQARNGASNGLLLWFNILLPTLLPFMILSDLIRRLHIIDSVCNRISSRTGKNLYFLYPLVLGLLCGLPLGAKLTAEAIRSGHLSCKQGQFLLTVCNNSSMMFLMGYVAEVQLQRPDLIGYFLLLIPLSSLFSAVLQSVFLTVFPIVNQDGHSPYVPHTGSSIVAHSLHTSSAPANPILPLARPSFISSVSSSIMDSFTVITQIGGFIILFSVLAEFAMLIDSPLTLPLVASLEMTTGIRAVCASSLREKSKILLSAASVSFSGFSGIVQTACVLSDTGISVFQYIISRLLSTVFTLVFFFILL